MNYIIAYKCGLLGLVDCYHYCFSVSFRRAVPRLKETQLFSHLIPTDMSFTPGTGGHGPRETREPGEVFICRPVLNHIGFSERDHLELVSVGVFKELNVNPAAADRGVVSAGQSQAAGHREDVRPVRQLVSARPAQDQAGGTAALVRLGISTRLTGL